MVGYDGGPSSGDNNKGDGGIGVQVLIAGPPASDQPVGTPGPASGGGYFAGGGAGGTQGPTHSEGGKGGGANVETVDNSFKIIPFKVFTRPEVVEVAVVRLAVMVQKAVLES